MLPNLGIIVRISIGVIILTGAIIIVRRLNLPTCSAIQQYFDAMDWHAWICFVLAFAIATVLFLPGSILTVLAGPAFGPWWGTAYVMFGAMIGVTGAFFISRNLAQNYVSRKLDSKHWFKRLRSQLNQNGLSFMLFARLVPFFPYNGLNYACGILPIRPIHFILGSAIGMLPGVFTYVYLGYAIGCAYIEKNMVLPTAVRQNLTLIIVVRIFLAFAGFWLTRKRSNADNKGV